MITRRVRLLMGTVLTGAMMALVTACPKDAANITEVKGTGLRYPVASQGSIDFPGGTLAIDHLTLAAFDTTVSDAFGRAIAGNRSFYSSSGSQFGGAYNMTSFLRTAATDPRTPALTESDPTLAANPDGLVLLDDSGLGFGCGCHDLFNDQPLTNLKPNTTYIIAFFRYGTNVNGQLDANLLAQGKPVDTPDDLVPVGGTPKGDPTVPTESFPTFVPFQTDANPFVVGNFTTDASGNGFWDAVIDGTGVLYSDDSGDPPDAAFDSSLVGRNDDTPTNLPRYNYLVILEGPAVDAADAADNPQAVRLQIAQDFLAGSGAMINNGYAPFPLAFTDQELIPLPGGAGRPDSLTVEFSHLPELAGSARWQAWLLNRNESPPTMEPAVGNYARVAVLREIDPITGELLSETDSTVETKDGTSTFVGQSAIDIADRTPSRTEIRHQLTLGDGSLGGGASSAGFFTDVVLTIEPGGEASSPSKQAPVFFQYTDQNGTPNNFFDDASAGGILEFGQFNFDDATMSRLVGPGEYAQATAVGNVLTEGVQPTAVSVEIKNLPLPPRGLYYEGWLMNPDDGSTISMGPITSEPPDTVSLFDVDVNTDLPDVTPTGIRFSNAYLALKSGQLAKKQGGKYTLLFKTFFLTLQPKVGVAEISDTEIQTGTLPEEAILTRLSGQ